MNALLGKLEHCWLRVTSTQQLVTVMAASKNRSSPLRSLLKWSCWVESVTRGAPVVTARSSRSATELTNSKPRACSRSASSRTKTPQFGCVAASTQTTLRTVTAHTNRTSSCLLLCTNPVTLEKKAGWVLN